MHPEAYDFVRQNCMPFRVCEFGSYNVNGSVRDLYPGWDYVGIDSRPGPGVDIVADCRDTRKILELIDYRFFNAVVCTEVLEHVEKWHQILVTARSILRIGGRFLCTAAGPMRQPHSIDGEEIEPGGDEWYQNVTPETLNIALRTANFAVFKIEIGRDGQDIYASAWA